MRKQTGPDQREAEQRQSDQNGIGQLLKRLFQNFCRKMCTNGHGQALRPVGALVQDQKSLVPMPIKADPYTRSS